MSDMDVRNWRRRPRICKQTYPPPGVLRSTRSRRDDESTIVNGCLRNSEKFSEFILAQDHSRRRLHSDAKLSGRAAPEIPADEAEIRALCSPAALVKGLWAILGTVRHDFTIDQIEDRIPIAQPLSVSSEASTFLQRDRRCAKYPDFSGAPMVHRKSESPHSITLRALGNAQQYG